MSAGPVDRRDFSRLSLAVMGGLVAGSKALGQEPPPIADPVAPPLKPVVPPKNDRPTSDDDEKPADADATKSEQDKAAAAKRKKDEEKPKEIHICRGLNTCKGKGASGENNCAGQGTCATTPAAPHECTTCNACRNQGGCGELAGKNQCAGYGEGAVPILEEEWPRLRKEFEYKMTRLKRKIGKAPLSSREVEWIRRKEEADAKWLAEIEAKKQEELAKKNGKGKDDKKDKKNDEKKDEKDSTDVLDDLTGGKGKDGAKK
jgi:hypothetical protein